MQVFVTVQGFLIKCCSTYPDISTFQETTSRIRSVSKICCATKRARHLAYILIKALATIHVFRQVPVPFQGLNVSTKLSKCHKHKLLLQHKHRETAFAQSTREPVHFGHSHCTLKFMQSLQLQFGLITNGKRNSSQSLWFQLPHNLCAAFLMELLLCFRDIKTTLGKC